MPLFKQEKQKVPSNLLKDRYAWPPFSILNTISWDWQRRVDDWKSVILNSAEGRDVKRYNATPTNIYGSHGKDREAESVSVFDPYLCELMYRWFSLPGMRVLDPFAGGCVRGEVAALLGRYYTGIDLSEKQVATNRASWHIVSDKFSDIAGTANWLCGDSVSVLDRISLSSQDMIFTCPPYYNLEQYTKDPRDLSKLPTYEHFLDKYGEILLKAANRLKEDSFFVIVVSEVRKDQHDLNQSQYLGLVPDTIRILRDRCFLHYYNEIILENSIGSLPLRAPKSFEKTRKIGRHHQNILVFYKGEIKNIEEKFGTNFL